MLSMTGLIIVYIYMFMMEPNVRISLNDFPVADRFILFVFFSLQGLYNNAVTCTSNNYTGFIW